MAMDLARVTAVTKFYSRSIRQIPHTLGAHERFAYLADFCDRLVDMVEREPERREKIMRWYGFTQGALWALGIFTVDEIKAHSNPDVAPPE